jgi:segregation and condensation protein B
MGRRASPSVLLDTELEELPHELRWRVWMGRVEAVIFASPKPVTREALARVVGKSCNLEALIEDIRAELVDRPYELVVVAGGWQHRTRKDYADAIRFAAGVEDRALELSKLETMVLAAIAYLQPVTRRGSAICLAARLAGTRSLICVPSASSQPVRKVRGQGRPTPMLRQSSS